MKCVASGNHGRPERNPNPVTDIAPAVPSSSRKAQAPQDYFLTVSEVAVILGIHRATVLREIERGNLRCSHEKVISPDYTRRRLLPEDLIDYCKKNELLRLHVERQIAQKFAA